MKCRTHAVIALNWRKFFGKLFIYFDDDKIKKKSNPNKTEKYASQKS